MAADDTWKTQNFRQSMIAKIDEVIQISGMPTTKNSIQMENHVFQKAKSKEEYLNFVARLIHHIREMNSKKGTTGNAPGTTGTNNQGMPDPIGALQTLAHQGTGNNQMMGMGGPGPNHQGIIPQPPANTATNRRHAERLGIQLYDARESFETIADKHAEAMKMLAEAMKLQAEAINRMARNEERQTQLLEVIFKCIDDKNV